MLVSRSQLKAVQGMVEDYRGDPSDPNLHSESKQHIGYYILLGPSRERVRLQEHRREATHGCRAGALELVMSSPPPPEFIFLACQQPYVFFNMFSWKSSTIQKSYKDSAAKTHISTTYILQLWHFSLTSFQVCFYDESWDGRIAQLVTLGSYKVAVVLGALERRLWFPRHPFPARSRCGLTRTAKGIYMQIHWKL